MCYNVLQDYVWSHITCGAVTEALRPGGALTLSSVVQSIVEAPTSPCDVMGRRGTMWRRGRARCWEMLGSVRHRQC